MSLTELLVSMTLMIIVGTIAVSFFVSSSKSASRASDASLATAQARTAMGAVTTLIRLADTPTAQAGFSTNRFENGFTAAQVTFYSNANNNRPGSGSRGAPDKVVLTATSTQLIEKLYPPKSATVPADYTQNYNSTPATTRVLVDGLGSTSVFTYCAVYDPVTTACATPATTGATVAGVTVTLTVTGLRGDTTQTLTSTVGVTGALS
jgi:type II secretory pathway pseudopilin PulG